MPPMPCSAMASAWSGASRTPSRPPCTIGCRVLTRPSIISGKPVRSETSFTGRPAAGDRRLGAAGGDQLDAQARPGRGRPRPGRSCRTPRSGRGGPGRGRGGGWAGMEVGGGGHGVLTGRGDSRAHNRPGERAARSPRSPVVEPRPRVCSRQVTRTGADRGEARPHCRAVPCSNARGYGDERTPRPPRPASSAPARPCRARTWPRSTIWLVRRGWPS